MTQAALTGHPSEYGLATPNSGYFYGAFLGYLCRCDVAWAKIVDAGAAPQKIWVHNTDSQYQFVTTGWFTGSGYTNMVQDGPGYQAQACGDNYPCTGWF